MKQIKIYCNPDGTVNVEAVGYKGKGCKQATQFMEEALGLDKPKVTLKPEYHQQVQEKQKV